MSCAPRIAPATYSRWRATTLGATTEAIEQRLILEMMGELSGARVLDAGCGDGALACAAASHGAQVTGIDADAAMLAAARSRAAMAKLSASFSAGRVERLPFPDGSFDVVASITVLCFVSDAALAVREMARVLRPGGRLILGELGRWSTWAAIRCARAWLGSATWRAARFRTAKELCALAEQAGLSTVTIRGAVYYPPVGLAARALAPFDARLSGITNFGAAFLALCALSENRP